MSNSPLPPSDPDEQADRRRWRICFWMIFVLAPVATMLFSSGARWMPRVLPDVVLRVIDTDVIQSLGMLAAPILGALGAGFCLTRLHAAPRKTLGVIVCTIAFGMGILVVYFAVAFVGCIMAFSKNGI